MAEQQSALGIQRGDYGRNNLATVLFVLGRLVTGPIQYVLIRAQPLSRLGLPPSSTGGSLRILEHNLPKLPSLVALLPGILSLKMIIWRTCYCRERTTIPGVLFGVLGDVVFESVTTLVFCAATKNPLFSERIFYTGLSLYFAGVAIELVAELQRAAFKRKPENEGKLRTTGFWSITRHINSAMKNVVYGFAYGLATGGPMYSIPTAGMYLTNFIANAMPSNEAYCKKKYGRQWEEYEKKTPRQLIPDIY